MLCSVALLTVTPPTNTGLSFAAGVSAPVRPTLKITSSSTRHLLVGGKLVRQRPARRARDEAELLLVGAPVYLVDHAVDLVRQLGAARADVAVILEAAFDAADLLRLRAGAQPQRVEPGRELAVPLRAPRRPPPRPARRNRDPAAAAR